MPYSSELCKAEIRDWLRKTRPETVLDIGAGSGTYSRLFRHLLPLSTWVALEIHDPYADRFQLKQLYDQVMILDVREARIGSNAFHAVLLGDVLEHLPRRDAAEVLADAWNWSDGCLIVSIPLGECPQGPSEGNEHEAHLTSWTYSEFAKFVVDEARIPKADHAVIREDADYRIGAFMWETS